MKNFIRNIIVIIEAFFYNIYMTCHPRFRSKKIKLRQIRVGDINPIMDSTYDWKNLQGGIKQLGVLKPLQVIRTDHYNRYGEVTYNIGNGHHRYYLFTYFKSDEDIIKVYSRGRTIGENMGLQTERTVQESIAKIKLQQKIYNKGVKKNLPYNSTHTLFNSHGKN